MPLLCIGNQNIKPTYYESLAAQMRVLSLFTPNFLARHPGGVVISELDHMGGPGFPPLFPGPVQYPGNAALTQIMEALTTDFRRWVSQRDYRKCDVLGISGYGDYAELLEVTTEGRASAAATQLRDKLDTLRNTVNQVYAASMNVDWQPSLWQPSSEFDMFYPLPSRQRGEVRYICYGPTARACYEPGVVLYEIHSLKLQDVPVPVSLPDETTRKVRQDFDERLRMAPTEEAWARQAVNSAPDLGPALTVLAVAGGIVMAVIGIAALFDPVPGDEVAAFSASMALFRAAGVL